MIKPTFVEVLVCVLMPGNTHDQYAVAAEKNGIVKGHFAMKDFTCLHSLSKERQSYSSQSNRTTEIRG